MKVIVCLFLLLALLAGCYTVEWAAPVRAALPALSPEIGGSVVLAEWNPPPQPQRLRRVDPATGRDAAGSPAIDLGHSDYIPAYRFSAGGRTLAVVGGSRAACEPYAGGSRCRAAAETLHLVDLVTWQEIITPLDGRGWAGPMAFGPTAGRLALVTTEPGQSALSVVDTATGKPLARRDLPFPPELLAYTGDGGGLMLYGAEPGPEPGISPPGPPQVLLLDAETLVTRWQQSLPDVTAGYWCRANCGEGHESQTFTLWQPAAVLSATGDRLLIVHANADRLTTVDFAAQTTGRVDIELAQSGWEWFLAQTAGLAQAKGNVEGAIKEAALSADGQRLYVIGWELAGPPNPGQTALDLQVIEAGSGRVVARSESRANRVWLAPAEAGDRVLLETWTETGPQTGILDAETLAPLARLEGWEVLSGRRLDGQHLLLARRSGRLGLVDPHTFAVTSTWPAGSAAYWLELP